jgi:cysteine synthase B
MNPGGSLKDRPVKRMLTQAIESGELTKDKIIIDSSSGNAGIAYSMIGNALGYQVEIVIPGNASLERKQRMIAHGTNIIETDPSEGYDEALRHVHKLVEADPDKYFLCDQYANDNNWLSHYHGTAEEILSQMDGEFQYFVGGVGTGGAITGIGRRLKEVYPNIKIHGVRPEVWPGIEGLKPLGSPEDIVPEIFDESVVDEWIYVTADEAKHWCNKVAKNGLFVGQSSGSYLAACSKLMEKIESGKIVTLFNDFGDRYFSAGLWS